MLSNFDACSETRKIAFHTLGCKLNFAESSTILREFVEMGFSKVEFNQFAHIYVINTCSVTENADKECKVIVRKARSKNPHAKIVVIGCYAQLKPKQIADIPGVDLVLGAKEKFQLPKYIQQIDAKLKTEKIYSCEVQHANQFFPSYSLGGRTRSFLKIQDGCDYKCTYCTIPMARGVSRSGKLDEILEMAEEIARKGVKEIVLTGVNIGDYGKGEFGNKRHDHTFLELLENLEELKLDLRFRISSIEPNLFTNSILEFLKTSKKFVSHFHLPLQSGCDHVLKKMKRRYLTGLYKQRVEKIKSILPDACIGADVLVGFPGESEEYFNQTYEFISSLNVSYLHVFTYSERQNTPAASFCDALPMEVRKERNKRLQNLSEKLKRNFYESQKNKTKKVLWENRSRKDAKLIEGYTDNYIRVVKPDLGSSLNKIEEVLLKDFNSDLIFEINQPHLQNISNF